MNVIQHLALQRANAKLLLRLFDRSHLAVESTWEYRKLKAEGYMDLSIDRLAKSDTGYFFALAHNGRQNGDVMADPDMEIVFMPGPEPRLRALHYQNDYVGVFKSTADLDEQQSLGHHMQVESDKFLGVWLKNLLDQGHAVPVEVSP